MFESTLGINLANIVDPGLSVLSIGVPKIDGRESAKERMNATQYITSLDNLHMGLPALPGMP